MLTTRRWSRWLRASAAGCLAIRCSRCACSRRFLPRRKFFLAAGMAREVGGARFAQFFAGLLVFLAPIYLTFDNFLSMNAFEPVFWMACAAIVLRVLNGGSPRLWLLFGLVAGIGILNKHSMLFSDRALQLVCS